MDEGPASKKAKAFAEKDPNKKDLATLPVNIINPVKKCSFFNVYILGENFVKNFQLFRLEIT